MPPNGDARQSLAAGEAALAAWALEEAIEHYRAALAIEELPEALEGLGSALLWSTDARESMAARERAYALYRERGDARSAARVALAMALASTSALGEDALAFGWIDRVRELLDGVEPCSEHAWAALWEGHLLYFFRDDLVTARRRIAEGLDLAERLGLSEALLFGRGLEGLTLLAEGRIEEGLRGLQQAATGAVSGEIGDLDANGNACCYLLSACEMVYAYDQAELWTQRIRDQSVHVRVKVSRSFCRRHWAAVLMWRGRWAEAEEELVTMEQELARAAPVAALDCAGRLGELRRRQGRYEEAEILFARAGGQSQALLGRAAIAIERGDAEEALRLVERFLRRLPAEERAARAPAWVLQARAAAALGDDELARSAVTAIGELTSGPASGGLEAMARGAEGWCLRRHDPAAARSAFEDAADLFARAGAPWEAACARLEVAEIGHQLGRHELARVEARAALEIFEELGASHEADRARRLLESTDSAAGGEQPDSQLAALSPRQLEVLQLVAQGMSNRAIGERLFVSELTVKRHVADILTRLDLPTRAAAAAWAARHGLVADA